MRIAYFDAFSGISGDMTVGALIDAGASAERLIEGLNSMETGGRFEVEKTKRGGVTASKFHVRFEQQGHPHRHLKPILNMIEKAAISDRAKQKASNVFRRLGEAEARVHGVTIEKVHFHEVGAIDSIADIVGACIALDLLDVDEVQTSQINVGSGTVQEEMEWIEYMTSDADSPMANLRRQNGRDQPWKVHYVAVGNESWGCGGNMTAQFYADNYRRYNTFVKNYGANRIARIAGGPSDTSGSSDIWLVFSFARQHIFGNSKSKRKFIYCCW